MDHGIGEMRIKWDFLRRVLDLPEGVEIVGAEIRAADCIDILLSGPGLPVVDQGSEIPRVVPVNVNTTVWQVYIEEDLKRKD